MHGNKKYSLEQLIEITRKLNPNIEILGEYNKIVGKTKKRNERRIKCKCKIDTYEFEKSVNELILGVGCKKCVNRVNANKRRLNINYIKSELQKLNPNIEILSEEYINARTPLKCKCLTHDYIWNTRWDELRKGVGCIYCKGNKLAKDNNPAWKGGITPLSNYLRDKLTQWKIDSLKKYNYKCAITGIHNDLIIHHLKGFNQILKETMDILNLPIYQEINKYSNKELKQIEIKCLELHYKYGLGICLNTDIHKEFHKIYGKGNNTLEQFKEFTITYKQNIAS